MKSLDGKGSGEAGPDGLEPGREEAPFGLPTQCPISQGARSHPPLLPASWLPAPSAGGPAQLSPTPGCARQYVEGTCGGP